MIAGYRFLVAGRVQGVYFRQSAAVLARRLRLRGWIRNRSDGRVEGVVAGEPGALDEFRAWLAQGPPAARVQSVVWEPDDQALPDGFKIRH